MTEFTATGARARHDEFFVYLTFSCGPKDGLVTITMTKADFEKDFVEPVVAKFFGSRTVR